MKTTIRVSEETKALIFDLKGGKSVDDYLKSALNYFKITQYAPEDITLNPVFDMGALFNKRFDQLKGMVVNFRAENNLRFDKLDEKVTDKGFSKSKTTIKEGEHIITNEELEEISKSQKIFEEQLSKKDKEIKKLQNQIRKQELDNIVNDSDSSIDITRLTNLIKDIDKLHKIDKFDTSQQTLTIDRQLYNLRIKEVFNILPK